MQDASEMPMPHACYIGDTNAEMLVLEWDGFEQGYASAQAEGVAPLTADQIGEAAAAACRDTLANYTLLNWDAFHDAYTHGWIAGYLAGQHGWHRPS